MTCDACPEPAVVFLPGSAEQRHGLILLARGVPLRAFCRPCAIARGWTHWIRSEAQPKRRPGGCGSSRR